MKIKDKKFIKEILSSDFKQISNPDFTRETLEKIAELKGNKIIYPSLGDITFLIPMIIYVSLFILLSLINSIFSWSYLDQINNVIYSIEMISNFLLHPITISILISFSLLYLLDLFLNKVNT